MSNNVGVTRAILCLVGNIIGSFNGNKWNNLIKQQKIAIWLQITKNCGPPKQVGRNDIHLFAFLPRFTNLHHVGVV